MHSLHTLDLNFTDDTMAKMENEYSVNRGEKRKLEDRKVALEELKFNWEMTKQVNSWLFGPGSDSSMEERSKMVRMLRTKFFNVMGDGIGITGMVDTVGVTNDIDRSGGAGNSAVFSKQNNISSQHLDSEVAQPLNSIAKRGIDEVLCHQNNRICDEDVADT